MMPLLRGVLPDSLDQVWPKIVPLLQATLNYDGRGYYEVPDLYDAIKRRDMQLWTAWDDDLRFFVITEIVNYPRKKVCKITWGGGRIYKGIHRHIDEIKLWATCNGCHSIQVVGRKGWNKVYAKNGFKPFYFVADAPCESIH